MRRREVKAILFDLDGVLVDSFDAWHAVFNEAMKLQGKKPIPKGEYRKNFGIPVDQDIKLYFQGKTPMWIQKQKNKLFPKKRHLVRLFPSTVPTLAKVKKLKIRTALISNSTRKIVHSVLGHFRIGRYFDVLVTAEDVRRGKPNPEMVLNACKKLRVNPSQAILVGDTQNDMIAGRRAGCIAVGYKTKGMYTITKLSSIISLLKKV